MTKVMSDMHVCMSKGNMHVCMFRSAWDSTRLARRARGGFHVLRTDRRAGVGLHSVVAGESWYGMLNRICFDILANTFE